MKKISNIILFLFSICSIGFSQNYLINASSKSLEELTEVEALKLENIQTRSEFSEYFLMEFNSLAENQENGIINISLPFDSLSHLVYAASSIIYNGELDYEWSGKLIDGLDNNADNLSLGYINLLSSEFGRIAYISIEDHVFELSELSQNLFVLTVVKFPTSTEHICAVTDTLSNTTSTVQEDANAEERTEGNCNVRCLVLYSDAALVFEGDIAAINNRARLAVLQTNVALKNSAIEENELTIELVGVENLPDFIEGQDIEEDGDNLPNNLTAVGLRDLHEADIVILLTNGAYPDGTGYVPFVGANNGTSFGIVETGNATGFYTFAHEIAHLFGAGHETLDNQTAVGFAHGFNFFSSSWNVWNIFKKRKIRYTVVHQVRPDQPNVRVPYYSNPEVKIKKQRTGQAGKADNAQQIRNESCNVSQFRQTIRPVYVDINGPLISCPCVWVSLCANTIGGTAGVSYTFVWESSIDGINWSFQSFGSSTSVKTPCSDQLNNTIWMRVTVTGSDGSISLGWHSIHRISNLTPEDDCEQPIIENLLTISPNPSFSSEINLTFGIMKAGKYTVEINNLNGKKVSIPFTNKYYNKGIHNYNIAVKPKGMFLVSLIGENGKSHAVKLLRL